MHRFEIVTQYFNDEFEFIPGSKVYTYFYYEEDKDRMLEVAKPLPGVRAIHNIAKREQGGWQLIETAVSGVRRELVINEDDRFNCFWEYIIFELGNYGHSFDEGCIKCSFGLFDGALAVRSDMSLTKAADTIVKIAEKMGLYGNFHLEMLKFKPDVHDPSKSEVDGLPSVEQVTRTVEPNL